MIVSGNNGWLSPDQNLWLANGFHNHAIHDLFDFVTHHPYPACQAVPNGSRGDPLDDGGEPLKYWLNACIGMSRLDHYGKPVVMQEFGWYGGDGASAWFLGASCPSAARPSTPITPAEQLVDALIPHANGFINWPTFDMPAANDISNHGGIFTHDGRPKELAKVYRDLAARLQGKRLNRAHATTTIACSLPALYTRRAAIDQLFDRVHEVLESGGVPDFRFIQ